jgi:hypothetical protein
MCKKCVTWTSSACETMEVSDFTSTEAGVLFAPCCNHSILCSLCAPHTLAHTCRCTHTYKVQQCVHLPDRNQRKRFANLVRQQSRRLHIAILLRATR